MFTLEMFQEESEQIQVNNIKEIIINHINIRRRQRRRERRATSRERSLPNFRARERSLPNFRANPSIPQGMLIKGYKI
jgi:hypothetical protein